MSTIAAILDATVAVVQFCIKCCKENEKEKKEKEKQDLNDKTDEDESNDGSDSEHGSDHGSHSDREKQSLPMTKMKKTKKKNFKRYSAVKQSEPVTAQPHGNGMVIHNQVNPTIIINSPHPPPALPATHIPGTPVPGTPQMVHPNPALPEQNIVAWVPSSTQKAGELVDRAVVGGYDFEESDLWIIRARFMCEIIPGKYNNEHHLAFAAHSKDDGYAERNVEVFEVCCIAPESKHRIKWVRCSNGDVPKNAVEGGKKASGEILYIGRKKHIDSEHPTHSLCPGLIQPSHGVLYITYGLTVFAYKEYEVLCIE